VLNSYIAQARYVGGRLCNASNATVLCSRLRLLSSPLLRRRLLDSVDNLQSQFGQQCFAGLLLPVQDRVDRLMGNAQPFGKGLRRIPAHLDLEPYPQAHLTRFDDSGCFIAHASDTKRNLCPSQFFLFIVQ